MGLIKNTQQRRTILVSQRPGMDSCTKNSTLDDSVDTENTVGSLLLKQKGGHFQITRNIIAQKDAIATDVRCI